MKIAVVTTTYQCAATIADCLDSVAGQSYANREHIVIDGGSTDGTLAVLESRRDQLAVLVSEPDGGTYFGLNKGIAQGVCDGKPYQQMIL
ncbi:glycosyltransferase [Thiohalocapsa marina]|uniref:Glycosyltransferase n=1 Tax=Thiohalocapsa marina TaxID=424902 RepID=A0A5M8FNH8_9GAMM|nr:glycosyltransferase [Thiohalocapsa marina]KAA6183965.1 glycosyltransferase [Thiohalocapsa marina]